MIASVRQASRQLWQTMPILAKQAAMRATWD
ncbi:hypothetical protein N826_38775 [Skermanella aerolata KACC 11604]|nr:hypothetical protein N826_38775 [Skermanella aerolata KACC 11604]